MQKKIVSYLFLFFLIAVAISSCQDEYDDPSKEGEQYFGVRTGVKIRGVVLTDFPANDPLGNTWDSIIIPTDPAGRPDIFYSFYSDIDTPYVQPFQFENVDRDSVLADSLSYIFTNEYVIDSSSFGVNIHFDIYDYEKDPISTDVDSTIMKSFVFAITPGDTNVTDNPYPTGLILNEDGYNAIILLDWVKKED